VECGRANMIFLSLYFLKSLITGDHGKRE